MNIRYKAIWKRMELPSREVVLLKVGYLARSTATCQLKGTVLIHMNGVDIYNCVPDNRNQIMAENRIVWIPAAELSIKIIEKYMTPAESREIVAVHRMNRNDLLQVIRTERIC